MYRNISRKATTIILAAAMCVSSGTVPVFASEMQASNNTTNVTQEATSTEAYRTLMQQYYKIPSAVRTLLADNGVTIQMVDQNIVTDTRKNLGMDKVQESGVWIPQLRLIEVGASYSVAGIGHEVGHALDDLLRISESANFKAAYSTEHGKLTLSGCVAKIESEKEYFAEAFNVYILNALLLKENCPKTYAYIEAAINQAAIVKNTNFIDESQQDPGTAGSSIQKEEEIDNNTASSSDQPTAESLGTSWDTYNPDEILKLPYINASDAARNTVTCANNVKSVFNGFLQLPSNVIRAFMKSGWTFEIVSGDELQGLYNQYLGGQSADGVNSAVFIGLHKVYIRNGAASGTENTKYVLAYFIDQMYRESNNGIGASDTDAFKAIYETEGVSWKEKNPDGTAMQYFANSVNNYLNNQAGFSSSRPQTAAYIAAALNALTEDSASIDNLITMYQTLPGYSIPKNQTEQEKQDQAQLAPSESNGTSGSAEVGIGFDPKLVTKAEDQAKIAVVSDCWQKVPTQVRNYLGSKHVGIIMEDPMAVALRAAVINGGDADPHIVGLWMPDANAISVGYNMPEISVCHEVGHALDEYTKASKTAEFKQIFNQEKGLLQSSGSSNYGTSAEEYFGEAFNQYCLRNDLLKQTCPNTYSYIEQLVSSVA